MSEIILYHGDCLIEMNKIADKSIDMILCDLPFGITVNKWDIIIPFEPLWKQYDRIIKNNGAIVLFGSEPFSSMLRISNLKMYRYDWYWVKDKGTNFASSHKQPLKIIETISVFYKEQCVYDYKGVKLDKPYKHTLPISNSNNYRFDLSLKNLNKDNSRIYVSYEYKTKDNLLKFTRDKNKLHPTQKPVNLLEYLIKTYTNKYDVVLDNCMGSGSTGVACVNTNRNFIGIEKEDKYFKIAEDRINNVNTTIFDI